jgi:two-component system, chemotaxis family, sensor kinase CheA
MDDVLSEFLIDSSGQLAKLDLLPMRLALSAGHPDAVEALLRFVGTVASSCSFAGLGRLRALAQSTEGALRAAYRRDVPIERDVLQGVRDALDRICAQLAYLEQTGAEPSGNDRDLLVRLQHLTLRHSTEVGAEFSSSRNAISDIAAWKRANAKPERPENRDEKTETSL